MSELLSVKNGKYKIVDIIGNGGTSCVYLVVDNHIGQSWAMKKIHKKNGFAVMLAQREIEMLKSIDYPMFPRITDAWQEEDAVYIVSDYIAGVRLDTLLQEGGVTIYQAIKWSKQILGALAYLHSLGPPILYLDLKPENIIVRPDGKLVLVDFGIAGRITNCFVPFGTPGYAAPEQISEHLNVCEATDIFAFGMTYYAMRTGCSPNNNINIAHEDIKKSHLHSREKAFLERCTATQLDKRFSTVDLCQYYLEHIIYNPFEIKKLLVAVGVMTIVIACCICLKQKSEYQNYKNEAYKQMLLDANKHIKDGNYTDEGIKIISSYINSGCMDSKVEQEFILIVALYYFEVQQDYKKAYRLFEELNENEYPEVEYYTELCKLQMSFDCDYIRSESCIKKLYGSMINRAPSMRKYENIYFVSYCFENFTDDKYEGNNKALAVLERTLEEIIDEDVLCEDRSLLDDDQKDMLIDKYNNRISKLQLKLKTMKTEAKR